MNSKLFFINEKIRNIIDNYSSDRKSPPSPLSPGQQKRVRFLVDNNDQSSMFSLNNF
jgi:hypothetical protein